MATPKWYVAGLKNVMGGAVDLDSDTFKLILVTHDYTPNQATHDYRNDLGSSEATGGSGYPAGGFTLLNNTLTIATLDVKWDSNDITQAIVGGPLTFRYGVIYKARGGSSAADELLAYVDLGEQTVTDETISITMTDQLKLTVT